MASLICRRVWVLSLCCLVISPSLASAAVTGSKRVLMLYSYGRNFGAYTAVSSAFESELAEHSKALIQFHEVSLPGPLFEPSEMEQPTLNYLHNLFGGGEPDLIVPVGGPAVRYALRFRQQLFPSAPLLLAGVEARHLKTFTLDTNTTAVAMTVDFPGLIEHARRILPGTTNFAVVLGRSRLEVFWKQELQREFAVFTNQLGFTWLDQYSLMEMQQQVRHLPPHTAIFFVALMVDAAGVPYESDKAIKALYEAANAPLTGYVEQALGLGAVGGPMRDPRALGQETARVATRILNGEPPGDIHVPPTTPTYDWRELRRWNISEDRLPPGSVVKFREPTLWERHRLAIVTGGSALTVQTGLIMGLVLSLRRSRKAERSLRESEERMKLAASAAKLGMWEWDFATNKIWVDARTWGRLETPVDNGSDHTHFMQMVHPEDRDGVAQAVAKAINGDGHYGHVHRRLLPDGQVRWIAAQAHVEFDAKHKPVRMRGVGMDITALRLAEDRARESERQFLLIANSSPVMMWTSRPDKLCDFVNEGWLKFRGRRLEQELGNGWAEGLHPEDYASSIKTYSEAFDARLAFTMEYRLLRHDGQYRWISDHGVPRYDIEKNFLGYIGSCVDVTERKETEQEAQRTKEEIAHMSRILMLGELAGSLAHELNQPLTAIVSSGEAAQRFMNNGRKSDEEVREALKDVVEQGQRAGEIIAGMRAMLKRDAGQMATQDINAAIRRVLELVRSDLVIRGLAATLRLDPQLPPVKGHGVQLQQVLLNLVINACDAMSGMPPGHGRLIIESRRAAAEGVEVSITDSGPGFSDEMLEHAFEPFRTTKPKGLGLGLAICRSIITMHGGRLAVVNNNSGKGATLRFTLPAQKEAGL